MRLDFTVTPPIVLDMSLCPQIINSTNNQTCADIALQYQVPSAGLLNLNNDLVCFNLGQRSICAPHSCPITINTGTTMSISPFLAQFSNFTKSQFLAWNQYIDTRIISNGDAVCVGPPGGIYVPPSATVATPSIYTSTATAADPTRTGTIPNCGRYYEVQTGDDCNMIAMNFSLTFSDLINMNPSIDSACSNLWVGYDYCVAPVNGTIVPNVTTTLAPSGLTSSTASILSSSTYSSTSFPSPPGPTVAGTTSQCTLWYTVQSGDTCASIDAAYSIMLSQFRAWNLYIDEICDNLWVGYSYFVSGPQSPTSASATSSAIATPTPTQTGMVSGCQKFYEAVSGDGCSSIASANGITTDQFISWNPAVGSDCSSLWAGYWYCISIS